MRTVLTHAFVGGWLSGSFGVAAIMLARYWSVPMNVFLAPAAMMEWLPIGWLLRQPVLLVVPEGGPPAGLLLVLGSAFASWFCVFSLASLGIARWRRLGV